MHYGDFARGYAAAFTMEGYFGQLISEVPSKPCRLTRLRRNIYYRVEHQVSLVVADANTMTKLDPTREMLDTCNESSEFASCDFCFGSERCESFSVAAINILLYASVRFVAQFMLLFFFIFRRGYICSRLRIPFSFDGLLMVFSNTRGCSRVVSP